ncbi:MAG: 2-oxoacid:acceptor oxidoreductase family protein [Erysipelotrichaceae bacterium]|nr:2-oxoacid:acceptor oxidoreductase family protein [Erysipelotrichaceae bacterium]
MIKKLFFAGSGGQGILMMGQIITYSSMKEDLHVTYLPSYGPEMRGGTANCTVVVSDKPVASPTIYEADVVVVMNLPSLIKFESLVKPGGKLFINTDLVDRKATRTDIDVYYVPCMSVADQIGNPKGGNMVMLGAILGNEKIVDRASVEYIMETKAFTGKKAKFLDINKKALDQYWK